MKIDFYNIGKGVRTEQMLDVSDVYGVCVCFFFFECEIFKQFSHWLLGGYFSLLCLEEILIRNFSPQLIWRFNYIFRSESLYAVVCKTKRASYVQSKIEDVAEL